MQCLCYPLTCRSLADPDSYQAAKSIQSVALVDEAPSTKCIGVVQLLNPHTYLGRVVPFKPRDIAFLQHWGKALFQSILSTNDENVPSLA